MAFDTERFLRIAATSPVLARNIVQVAVLEGDHVRYLGEHVGRDPFASTARPGDVRDVDTTALGIAILAGLPPADAEAVVARLPVAGRERARTATALARTRGSAIDPGQVHPSVFGVAVPVPGNPGVAVGVPLVEVLHEQWREDSRRYQEVISALRAAAGVQQPVSTA
jgi:DNA-binding IclR family transcriptional regulator